MKLQDIVRRQSVPKPWAEGEKIPWNDPDFSRRMLDEHLSQEHNADIVKTADWIIDLGPEGGREGGRIVVAGPPEEVARRVLEFARKVC